MTDIASGFAVLLQLFFVDLLLGADNAIVIALACRRLTPRDAWRAAFLGAGGAIVLRLVLAMFASALIGAPLVNLAAAWMLMVIALNLRAQSAHNGAHLGQISAPTGLLGASAVIIAADAAMSLDNVVALASIAAWNFWLLAIGVLMSIPIIVYAALILTKAVRRIPELTLIGAAFLGWIAGGMAVSDPLVSGWIGANAPALGIIAPALFAAFVVIAGGGARTAPRLRTPALSPEARRPIRAPRQADAGMDADALSLLASPRGPLVPAESPLDALTPKPAAATASRKPERAPPVAQLPAPEPSPAPQTAPEGGWNEERLVIAGFVALAVIAGLIILVASFFDSLT